MSQKIRLSSKLPGDEAINGLDQLADSLVEHPRPVCAIDEFSASMVEDDDDSPNRPHLV